MKERSKSIEKMMDNSDEKPLELGIHLQKDRDGKIYKYTKHHIRSNKGNVSYVYYCAETKCNAKGNYNVDSMDFVTFREHDIPYNEHCYIKNKNRFDKFTPIIEEFEKRDCREAQVFKKDNGSQLVKWYD